MRAVVALASALALPLSMTACPALLSDDFRIVSDSGAGLSFPMDGSGSVADAGSSDTSAPADAEVDSGGSGETQDAARDAADGSPQTLCCLVGGTSDPCTATATNGTSNWECPTYATFYAGCPCGSPGGACNLVTQTGPGTAGTVVQCP